MESKLNAFLDDGWEVTFHPYNHLRQTFLVSVKKTSPRYRDICGEAKTPLEALSNLYFGVFEN